MSHPCNLLLLLALVIVGSSSSARGEITAEQVRESIDQGVDFLLDEQHPVEGNWPDYFGSLQFQGGSTALNTLALLEAGVPVEDERIQRALDYLRQLEQPTRTYVIALQVMVFAAAEPERDLQLIRRNANLLEQFQRKEGQMNGAWGYSAEGNGADNSNTQFAILALHEAERVGVPVADATWRRAMHYWIDSQNPDGSWGYLPTTPGTGSMSCAGVASLVMATGRFSRDATVRGEQIYCCGAVGHEAEDQELVEAGMRSIDLGLSWLGRNFVVSGNPTSAGVSRNYKHYYLYALERVGRMTGQRFLHGQNDKHYDWYREGADHLIANQDRFTHSWVGEAGGEERADLATSMALLFLAKGRRPVLMAKLAHNRENDDWNLHRGDVAHLTTHMEDVWDQHLTWQTIDLEAASTEDLLQAPIVFLTGREALDLADPVKANLKAYIESGGFLLAAANDDGEEFEASFRELMKELFPYSDLRLLEADHPIWFAQEAVEMDPLPELWGLDACCRTSVVFCPATHEGGLDFDLSCRWELAVPRAEYAAPVERQVKAGLAIGANILAYATGRELRDKLDVPNLLEGGETTDALERGMLRVGSLDYDGGNDDAPNALPNLLGVFQDRLEMPATTPREQITLDSHALPEFPVLFMHGRRSFRFSPLQRRQLAEYLDNGGVIFADAICANDEFAESFRREMRELLPEGRLERIPLDHPIFTSEYRGYELPTVQLRDPHIRQGREALRTSVSEVTPLLEGIEVDGRYVVIFSPNDISCALEAGVSQDCKGYVREDAARLGVNILLYALQQ